MECRAWLLAVVNQNNSVRFRNSTGFVIVGETGYDGVLQFSIIIAAFIVALSPSGKPAGQLTLFSGCKRICKVKFSRDKERAFQISAVESLGTYWTGWSNRTSGVEQTSLEAQFFR